jgi:rhomboid protease GluP
MTTSHTALPLVPVDHRRVPVFSGLVVAACVAVFVGHLLEPASGTLEAVSKWGYYSTNDIREGSLWGLVTSVFVHVEPWHLGFNLYWLWILGARLERAIGSSAWLAFFLGAATVSSAAQTAVAGTTGIGASGVVYAFFGFMWTTKRIFPQFNTAVGPRTTSLFVLWLVACLGLTLTGQWDAGNTAHISGVLFGVGCGSWFARRDQRLVIAAALGLYSGGSMVGLYWAPWSSEWTGWRAFRAHRDGDYDAAVRWYRRSLELGQDPVWCWENLALAYHASGDEARYDEAIRTLRALDNLTASEVESETAVPAASER